MQPEDMILVSVDDHLVEPPNLFDGRMPSTFVKRAPRVVRQADGPKVSTFTGTVDHDVTVRSFDHGRLECAAGVSLGSMSAKLNV